MNELVNEFLFFSLFFFLFARKTIDLVFHEKNNGYIFLKNGYIYFEWENDKNISIDNILTYQYFTASIISNRVKDFQFVFFLLSKTVSIKRLNEIYNEKYENCKILLL